MAWYCTVDRVTEPGDNLPSRVGWYSRDWNKNLNPTAANLNRWRCLDADGEVYYEGVSDHDSNAPEEVVFAPLDDFAMPDAGAVEIQYREGGKWVSL